MALNFPNSPADGELYTDTTSGNRWVWDNANTVWKSTSTFTQTITVSSTQPGSPVVGQLWWSKDYGRLFVYYDDGNSQQWVEANPADQTAGLVFNTANAAFGKANNALANASGVVFNGLLTTSGKLTASGLQISGNVAPATGASPGIYSYEYPYVRQYVGDGTGYSFALSKKTSGGVLTDMVVLNDITGYLGVGTTSPSYLMHVANGNFAVTSSTGAGQIQITDDSDSGRGLLLKSNHSGTSNTYVGTNSSIKNIIFGIDQIERMRLDTSGRHTRPFQPCWVGTTGTFSGTVTGSPNHVSGINYSGSGLPNGTLVNVGSIWNTTTGRVTIPVTGYYQINIIGHKDTNTVARDAIATLSVNGGYYEAVELYGNYQDGGGSIILYLSANDWVEAGRNNGFANMSRVTFSGYLLG